MKIKYLLVSVFLPATFLVAPPDILAEEKSPQDRQTLTFQLENDIFAGTDQNYTSGVALTWLSPDLTKFRDDPRIPSWGHSMIERMPVINEPGYQRNISLSLVQKIYTPEDISSTELIEDDRPYAGMTYFALGLHRKNGRQMDTIEIDLGIIGPHSYAAETQKLIHSWTGSPDPKGWENQIQDEPIFNLFYERKWRWLTPSYRKGFSGDIISHAGAGLGNAYVGGNTGFQVRYGYNIPQDFGTYVIRQGTDTSAPLDESDPRLYQDRRKFGIHVFGGMDGRIVLRNITLDGNTCKDSHSVDKEPFVADFIVGLGMLIHRFKFTWAYVHRTKEFELQETPHKYGSVAVSYSF